MNNEDILLEISHELEDKYGVPTGIFHELGYVLVKDVGISTNPINPKDIETIIQEVAEKFGFKSGDIAYSINQGDILVGLPSN